MRFPLPILSTLALALLASASPHAPSPRWTDEPVCPGSPVTYTYTSTIIRTYTATSTYLSRSTRTSTPAGVPVPTRTEIETRTRTITDAAPPATVTVTKTESDTFDRTYTRTYTNTLSTPVTVTAVAAPAPSSTASAGGGECNTGPIQCCETVADAQSDEMSGILAAIGVEVKNIVGMVGTSCSPISALALGGGVECNQKPVCCDNNTYQGLVNIGCVPIEL